MNENEKDNEEHELEAIRLKKMKALVEAKKREDMMKQRTFSMGDKVEFVLRSVLAYDAYKRLVKLRQEEPMIYQRIYNELISPEVLQEIDYLIAIIKQRGSVPRKIPLDVIIYLERKAKGIKGKIQVKKGDGEVMDLSSYLTKK